MNHHLKSQVNRYLEAIQPTKGQRELAKDELSFLERRLSEYIREDDPFKFVKALRSGSFAKATALRRTETADFDADIAVYVEAEDEHSAVVANLIVYLENLARRAYEKRTVRKPNFETNESCVRVVFDVTPKINIDIVPVVAIDHASIPNWGILPKRDGTQCYTAVSEHIEFVRSRNDQDSAIPFRKLIRLFKRWRNGAFSDSEREKVGSFFLELVLGKAYDERKQSLAGEALPDLSLLAGWIVQHGFENEISFPDSRVPPATVRHSGPVIVLDPINRDDNVAADWTSVDRDMFLDRLDKFRDILRDVEIEAQDDTDAAIDFLDQIFPNFSNLSQEE